jgi:diadenosine tetraphosphate (Ap4A) HIT family hydrolase
MAYDPANIFARILRGEIPCNKVFEDEHVLAFRDIAPQAKEHVLVIPKGAYVSTQDFAEAASPAEQAALMAAIGKVARLCGLAESGYRVIANTLDHGRQEVPHLHFHLVGGQRLGRMLPID